jgi:hypothetical protein
VLIYPRARITVLIPLGIILYHREDIGGVRGRVLVRAAADQRGDGGCERAAASHGLPMSAASSAEHCNAVAISISALLGGHYRGPWG